MTPEERDLIGGLFQRLQQSDGAPVDREAADFIAHCTTQVPAAPYYLTQAVLVQDHALKGAQARIADLEHALEQARTTPATAPASAGGTSFLGGLLGTGAPAAAAAATGPWGRHTSTLPPQAALPPQPAAAPAAYYPHPASAVPTSGLRGGGFLQSALSTAAGVAGGAMLFQGIEGLLGYHNGPFSGMGGYGMGGYGGGLTGQPGMVENNTTINNYGDAAGSNSDPSPADDPGQGADPGGQGDDGNQGGDGSDQAYDDGGGDQGFDGGGDDGGGGDYA